MTTRSLLAVRALWPWLAMVGMFGGHLSAQNDPFLSGAGAFTITGDKLVQPLPRTVYIRGSLNNWGNNGLTDAESFVFAGANRYRLAFSVAAGSHQWKVGDQNWTADTNFGANVTVVLGTEFTLSAGGASPNINFSSLPAGEYAFVLDTTSTAAPKMTVTAATRPFAASIRPRLSGLAGSATKEFRYLGGGVYFADIEATSNLSLTLGDAAGSGWGLAASGAVSDVTGTATNLTVGTSAGAISFQPPYAGRFRFYIDGTTPTAPKLQVVVLERFDYGVFGEPVLLTLNGTEQTTPLTRDGTFFDWIGVLNPGSVTFRFRTASTNRILGASFPTPNQNVPITVGNSVGLVTNGNTMSFTIASGQGGTYRIRLDATGGTQSPTALVSRFNSLVVNYFRFDNNYTNWGMHLFNVNGGTALPPTAVTTWPVNTPFPTTTAFGRQAIIPIQNPNDIVGMVVHQSGSAKDMELQVRPADALEVWLVENVGTAYTTLEAANDAKRRIALSSARWLSRRVLAWTLGDQVGRTFKLYGHPNGEVYRDGNVMSTGTGGVTYDVPRLTDSAVRAAILSAYPYADTWVLLDTAGVPDIATFLQGHMVVAAFDGTTLNNATGVQNYGILDDLYTYTGDLGVTWSGGVPTITLWAPTARTVRFVRYTAPNAGAGQAPVTMAKVMDGDRWTGAWRTVGEASWKNQYYQYEVEVFVPSEQRVVTNTVTDPYSHSLSLNSRFTQIVDMDDPALKPTGWDAVAKPALAPEDITIYELHVRDFSMADTTVPATDRGTFKAFTHTASNGMQHLRQLAEAGMTHVQLLPMYDFGSVDEGSARVREFWPNPTGYTPASSEPQRIVNEGSGNDGFNWGYDPVHYLTPEGSYSTNPDSNSRVLQLREAVLALHNLGLRVVQDVVFNHTYQARQQTLSVLDKVVPNYYYRLDSRGQPHTDVCCPEVMTENKMAERLMIDALYHWAKYYKMDGFRFDLMGDHTVDNLLNAKTKLASLSLGSHGVDGPGIYLYGEGWSFGSLLAYRSFQSANQNNLGGSGIGSFNDRIRDAIGHKTSGGFIDGSYTQIDRLKSGLAANLRNVSFPGVSNGGTYTTDPAESMTYLTAHDNYTLWDEIVLRNGSSTSTAADRDRMVRMHRLGLALISVAQGPVFYHAGEEIHRSKSGDRNSYNSGDWFNRMDFSYGDNNWARGLPPNTDGDNVNNYPQWTAVFGNRNLDLNTATITQTFGHFREMLAIRRSSPLFRLKTADDIRDRVRFLNVGAGTVPGIVAYSITDGGSTDLDPNREWLLVLANGNSATTNYTVGGFLQAGQVLRKHTLQQASVDPVIAGVPNEPVGGVIAVPGKTLLVFESTSLPNLPDTSGIAPYTVTPYLRGTFNNWGNSGLTVDDAFYYEGSGYYRSVRTLAAGPYTFKVGAAAGWDVINYGATGAMALGSPKTLAFNGSDLTVSIATSGLYEFALDARNSGSPALTIRQLTGFAAWRAGRWSLAQWVDAAIGGPTADPDRDGLPNFLEYALNQDPTIAGSVRLLPEPQGDGNLRFTFAKPAAVSGVTFRVERSANPGSNAANWSTNGLTIEADTGTELRVRTTTPPSAGEAVFLRLVAEEPAP